MVREEIETAAAPTWAPATDNTCDWRAIDRALRTIARRRAALDAEEARWLREAERVGIWKPLGMVNALDYMERVLGYAPRTAQDRLRVARALGDLPELDRALAGGELPFSAVRELTRVATPTTAAAWVRAARGKNLRQIEELVAEHQPGDHPDDPPTPSVRTHTVELALAPEAYAIWRQARAALDDAHGRHLDDSELAAALGRAALERAHRPEATGRATYQIAITQCGRCGQGWQHGAGVKVPIGPAAVERAACDAQYIGSIDDAAPERAYQDVSPATARLVWHRDGGCCRVPGCRSAVGVEIHHLVHRVDGGGHEASNLILACSSCHQAHHDGRLRISGTSDHIEAVRPAEREIDVGASHTALDHVDAERTAGPAPGRTHVGVRSNLELTIRRSQAKDTLVRLGWKPTIARDAVDAALEEVDASTPVERLVFEALRRCPKPTTS